METGEAGSRRLEGGWAGRSPLPNRTPQSAGCQETLGQSRGVPTVLPLAPHRLFCHPWTSSEAHPKEVPEEQLGGVGILHRNQPGLGSGFKLLLPLL